MPFKKIKFIDLFAGIGGFRIAFEEAGAECVFSSEIDKWACTTYKENFSVWPSGDITKIHSKDIPTFDILCAGFPCQPFSIAGKRMGFNDARGTLFFEIARILKDKRPKAFLLENVKGLINHDNGKTIKIIIHILKELNYEVEWRILNAKNYGVPQNRERWYCVGFDKNLHLNLNSVFPLEKSLTYSLRDIIRNNNSKKYKISKTCQRNIMKNVKSKHLLLNKCSLAYEIRPSRCQFANNYISPCLTAKMGTGGNNVPVVISQKRKLTQKECLKIMGFPNTFKIANNYQSYKQIGNSVVVPIIKEFAISLINSLKAR